MSLRSPFAAARACPAIAALVLALLFAGCAARPWNLKQPPGVSPAPQTAWTPPPEEQRPTPVPEQPPAPAPSPATAPAPLTLSELLDIGLAHHPDTRAAWLAAQSAAAGLAASQGTLYPRIAATAFASRSKVPGSGGSAVEQTTYGPGIEVSWLLLDFGGRRAGIEQARQTLIAADWTHNAAIADRVLEITSSYHDYQAAQALREAQLAVVKEATINLEAAQARHDAGLATLSDVLQARTALSSAELRLATYEGAVARSRGVLNNAAGRGAAEPIEIEGLPADLPVSEVAEQIKSVIADALARRPEIAAAEARTKQAQARLDQAKAEGRPSISFVGTAGRVYFTDPAYDLSTYTGAVAFRWPVFSGWAQRANVAGATVDLETARARAESLRRQIDLEIFTSFHDVHTAAERVRTSRDLMASATQNQDAALGRYNAGVGSIIELVAAQGALADARSQEVLARTQWLDSLAHFVHDRGAAPSPAAASSTPAATQKGNNP